VGVPALLIPLVTSYGERWRTRPAFAVAAMVLGGTLSLAWLLSARIGGGAYWMGVEPIYPGLLLSALIWALGRTKTTKTRPLFP